MQIFGFNLKFYDSIDHQLYERNGLVAGNSVGDAADRVASRYGRCGDIDFDMLTIQVISGAEDGIYLIKDEYNLDDVYAMQDA